MSDYTTDFMMRLHLVDGPVNEPLTAAEARARLNIGAEVTDAVMESYLLAARQRIDGADGYLGRGLITQTWMGNLDCFPYCNYGKINIPLPPLQEVLEFSYLGTDGISIVVDPSDYRIVQGARPYLLPAYGSAWPVMAPRTDAISITFTVGYGDNGIDVPEPIRTAIALAATHIRTMSTRNPAVIQEVEEGIGATRYGGTLEMFNVIDNTVQSLLSTYRVIWL